MYSLEVSLIVRAIWPSIDEFFLLLRRRYGVMELQALLLRVLYEATYAWLALIEELILLHLVLCETV